MLVAPEVLDGLPDERAPRVPQDQSASRFLGDGEQVKVLAELPVVAPFDLLKPGDILVKLILRRERDAVDALEHLVLLAAAPVGAGNGQELERLDLRRGRHMGTPAKIGKIILLVDRDRFVGQFADQLCLVRLASVVKERQGIGLGNVFSRDRRGRLGQLRHLLFYLLRGPPA